MKHTNFKGSFVRIFSFSKEITGAGILVADNLILTCAHVVAEALGIKADTEESLWSIDPQEILQQEICLDFPFIAPREYLYTRVIKWLPPDQEGRGDISGLEINGSLPDRVCVGRLIDIEEIEGHHITTFGFPGKYYNGIWVEGIVISDDIGGRIQIEGVKNIGLFVYKGFSGAPVWDDVLNGIIGMVVSADEWMDNKTAFILRSSFLVKVFPELKTSVSSLYTSSHDRVIGLSGGRGFGPIAVRMCNRGLEDQGFREFFIKTWRECPNHPQFYMIPGRERECHESLIERLKDTRVKDFIKLHLNKTVRPYPVHINWDLYGNDLSLLKKNLLCKLFDEFQCDDHEGEYPLLYLCRQKNLKAHGVVMIVHEIRATRWNNQYPALIRWYTREYWASLAGHDDIPLFLIFFNILYPDPESDAIKRIDRIVDRIEWLKWKLMRKKRISKALGALHESLKEDCRCYLFQELQSIQREDVKDWFSTYCHHLVKKEQMECVNDLYKGRKQLCMAEVESALQKVIKQFEKSMSGIHPDIKESEVW